MNKLFSSILIALVVFSCNSVKKPESKEISQRWTIEQAKKWGAETAGCVAVILTLAQPLIKCY